MQRSYRSVILVMFLRPAKMDLRIHPQKSRQGVIIRNPHVPPVGRGQHPRQFTAGSATAVTRSTRCRASCAGAAALAGDTAAAAKRLAMAGSEVPAIAGPAGQGAADGAVVVPRSDRRGPLPACL